MKKLLVTTCSILLLSNSFSSIAIAGSSSDPRAAEKAHSSSRSANQTSRDNPKSSSDASPVSKTASGADYSSGAGNKAAQADMALSSLSLAASVGSFFGLKWINHVAQWSWSWGSSEAVTLATETPTWIEAAWNWVGISVNPFSLLIQLGHAAVNRWMRDATNITASFTGGTGFVTDKWVGPPARNKTFAIMGDVGIESQNFGSLAFNPNEYKLLSESEAKAASATKLMKYREETLLEDQRSLSNVTQETWGVHYRAQQRSIQGLAGALTLKQVLDELSKADGLIDAEYGSKPKALNTVAARRALHDALMLLKIDVMAARAKIRAETLELDFKPLKQKVTEDETPSEKDEPKGPGSSDGQGGA